MNLKNNKNTKYLGVILGRSLTYKAYCETTKPEVNTMSIKET